MREIGTINIINDVVVGDPALPVEELVEFPAVMYGRWIIKVIDIPGRTNVQGRDVPRLPSMGVIAYHEDFPVRFQDTDWEDGDTAMEVDSGCVIFGDRMGFDQSDDVANWLRNASDRERSMVNELALNCSSHSLYLPVSLVASSGEDCGAQFNSTCVVKSGLGDGSYLVDFKTSDNGRLRAIRIDFGALAAGYEEVCLSTCTRCNIRVEHHELALGLCEDCIDTPFCNHCERHVDSVDENGYCDRCVEESSKPLSKRLCEEAARQMGWNT